MTKYNKESVEKELKAALKSPETLYQQDFIKRIGIVENNSFIEAYSDILLKNLWQLDKIKIISRKKYLFQHKKQSKRIAGSNRKEELKVIEWINKDIGELGLVIDYQVPLKSKEGDKAGRIDFISIKNHAAFLVEFKLESEESLLKAILEIETYSRIIDLERLKKELMVEKNCSLTGFKKAVLFDKKSKMYKQYLDLNKTPGLKILLEKLNIEIYILEDTTIKAEKP
jgi:hypothetical protein